MACGLLFYVQQSVCYCDRKALLVMTARNNNSRADDGLLIESEPNSTPAPIRY